MSLAFLSPSRCAEGTVASPLRRALEGADPAVVRDLSLEGIVEIRGDVDAVVPGAGEELVRLSPRRAFLFTDGDPGRGAPSACGRPARSPTTRRAPTQGSRSRTSRSCAV